MLYWLHDSSGYCFTEVLAQHLNYTIILDFNNFGIVDHAKQAKTVSMAIQKVRKSLRNKTSAGFDEALNVCVSFLVKPYPDIYTLNVLQGLLSVVYR